eukprot:8823337-Pyramimonas_sp.AAC.1
MDGHADGPRGRRPMRTEMAAKYSSMVLDVITSLFSPKKDKGAKVEKDTRRPPFGDARRTQDGRPEPTTTKRQYHRSSTM